MFFKYIKQSVHQVNDAHDIAGIEEQARALSMDIDDAAWVNGANDYLLNENNNNRKDRKDSVMSYFAVAINNGFMGNLLNGDNLVMVDAWANDAGVSDDLMTDNNDNRGGNGTLMMIDTDAGANGNLMNDNNANEGGNGNLMLVDVCTADADADDGVDAGTGSDLTNEQDAVVKDQAAKPETAKRRSKRRKVKVTYKNSKYGGGYGQDGLVKRKWLWFLLTSFMLKELFLELYSFQIF